MNIKTNTTISEQTQTNSQKKTKGRFYLGTEFARVYNSLCCNKSVRQGDRYCWHCGVKFTEFDVQAMKNTEKTSVIKAFVVCAIIVGLFVLFYQ